MKDLSESVIDEVTKTASTVENALGYNTTVEQMGHDNGNLIYYVNQTGETEDTDYMSDLRPMVMDLGKLDGITGNFTIINKEAGEQIFDH